MGDRGRVSGAEIHTLPHVRVIEHPEPPEHLGEAQAQVWREVVGSRPADYFGAETHALLEQYCTTTITLRRTNEMLARIADDPEADIREIDRLQKMTGRQTNLLMSLATKLRLTQQANVDPRKSKGPTGRKPWDTRQDSLF